MKLFKQMQGEVKLQNELFSRDCNFAIIQHL
jgi:hypothetical protein